MSQDEAAAAIAANRKLLAALARHHVPVTGFVIQNRVEALGTPAGTSILNSWVVHGHDLGNHSYAHLDFNDVTLGQFEDQVVRGETAIAPIMESAGRTVTFFRFPFNHTGNTGPKHRGMSEFLRHRGYQVAPCTIENSDWMFASAYARMMERNDRGSIARLQREYLAFTTAQIDYFSRMNAQVLGYEPPEIMLLHDNQLNADVMDELLNLFEKRAYTWVTLSAAVQDPVYQAPDIVVTEYGPMWGYRWARERGIKVDGKLEPEPAAWVSAYGGKQNPQPRRPRSTF